MDQVEQKTKDKVVAPNLIERVGKNGKSYLVRFREKGIPRINETFKDKKKAQAYIHEVRAKANRGEAVDLPKVKATLLRDIFDEYAQTVPLPKNKIYSLNALSRELGGVRLSDFKSGAFSDYLKHKRTQEIPDQIGKKKEHPLYNGNKIVKEGKVVKRTYAEGTVRKYYYVIKTALEWHAMYHGYTFDSKPFDDNDPGRAWAKPRTRVLREGELDKLILACDKFYKHKEEMKALLKFQQYSCMRIGEALLMKWSDIVIYDDENLVHHSHIFVPKENQKTSEEEDAFDRKIPLRPEFFDFVKNELFKIKKKNQELVFGDYWKASSYFSRKMKTLCKNAGVEQLVMHDLRHHSVSWYFINTSLSQIEVSRITGHLDLDTLKRYLTMSHGDIGRKLWGRLPAM